MTPLVELISDQMFKQQISARELGRRSKVGHATISNLILGHYWTVNDRVLRGLARGLKLPVWELRDAQDAGKVWRDEHLAGCAQLSDAQRAILDGHLRLLLAQSSLEPMN